MFSYILLKINIFKPINTKAQIPQHYKELQPCIIIIPDVGAACDDALASSTHTRPIR